MSVAVRVEPAGLVHTAVLVELYGRCFDDPWSTRSMAAVLGAQGAFAAIALLQEPGGATPIGFALARHVGDEAELVSIGVLPTHRGRGIAAVLLRDVIGRARAEGAMRLLLEVAESNEPARALYAAHGFAAVGRRPDYYQRANTVPVAALTMALELKRVLPFAD